MNFSDLITSIMEKMRKAGGVDVAFGNPQTVNDLTIIPVAKVSYGFGAGGGKSVKVHAHKHKKNEHPADATEPVTGETPEPELVPEDTAADADTIDNKTPKDEFGGGGGGGMRTQPLGIFVVHNNHVKFLPVLTVKEVSIAIGLLMVTLWRIFRKKR